MNTNYKDELNKAPVESRIPILSEWFRIMAVNETIETVSEGKLNGWKMKALHNSIKNYEMIRNVKFNFEVIYSVKDFLTKLPEEEVPETIHFVTQTNILNPFDIQLTNILNPFDIQLPGVLTNIIKNLPNPLN